MAFFRKKRKNGSDIPVCGPERKKYGNELCKFDGIQFDSRKEMERYIFLKSMKDRGEISDLKHHEIFEIIPHITETYEKQLKTKTKTVTRVVQKAVNWEPDFTYIKDGVKVYEDVKGSKKTLTKDYKLKKKFIFALHGIKISEVYNPTQTI